MKKYGVIKQSIVTYLSENYSKGNFKSAFNNAVIPLLQTKRFKEIYHLYSLVEESVFDDHKTAEMFLNEVVDKIELLSRGLKLHIPIEITNTKSEPNPIYESIDTILCSNGSTKIMERVEAKQKLIQHLCRTKQDNINFAPVNETILITLLTNQFNEEFGKISEQDKENISKYLGLSEGEMITSMTEKKTLAIEKLNNLITQEISGEEKRKLKESIDEINLMETNRYNLFRLNNLITDLSE